MTDLLIIEKAIEEIQIKNFGTTEQLLEIHEIVYVNDLPKVLRVDKDNKDGTAIVYFPIKNEKFYLAVYVDTKSEISVKGVGTEYYNSVYLKASSETLDFTQLASLTKLTSTGGWNKGDLKKWGNSVYKYSIIYFEPNPEPDKFEDKLKKLLDFLEQDKEGVLNLSEKASAEIQVATVFHNGNTMLGGHHIDKFSLQRIAALNLEIDFDLYAEGNLFKD